MTFSFQNQSVSNIYQWLVSIAVPRPIAIVSTLNDDNTVNLASFSFFNAICSNPPTVMFSIARKKDGSLKDTLINLQQRPEMVIHIANEILVQIVDACGEDLPYGISEATKLNLTPLQSSWVKPPRYSEFPVALECTLNRTVQIGDGSSGSSEVIFANVLGIHVKDDLIVDGNRVSASLLQPLSRLGREGYSGTRVLGIKRTHI